MFSLCVPLALVIVRMAKTRFAKVRLNIKKSEISKANLFVRRKHRGESISDKFQICPLLQTACYIII